MKTVKDITETNQSGAAMILEERRRQIATKNRTIQEDVDYNSDGSLASCAALYALWDVEYFKALRIGFREKFWLWEKAAFKPKSRLENLVRAGALIAAEIDRIKAD